MADDPPTVKAFNATTMTLKKARSEPRRGAELLCRLGYTSGSARLKDAANHRNGSSDKTIQTEDGSLSIAVPRDRARSFEPLLIGKHEQRFNGFDDKILPLSARGMTMREIQGFLAEQYGTDVSPEFISLVTDAVMAEVTA